MAEDKKKIDLPIAFPDELKGGAYANNMLVRHTKEEFIIDFIMVAPPAGAVTSRIILSPGHMKRVLSALQENLTRYENNFGELQPAPEPDIEISH